MDEQLHRLAKELGESALQARVMITTAESCTGGWVAEVMTSITGSSKWFERGFVTYSNLSKQEMLGVSEETLVQHGAVSEQTVREMARGALQHSHAHLAVAISGIAGPGGATLDKPVGTVCLAWAAGGEVVRSQTEHYSGNREEIRRQAVIAAIDGMLGMLAERELQG
jgi:nicotinamide-nucleotide amidase